MAAARPKPAPSEETLQELRSRVQRIRENSRSLARQDGAVGGASRAAPGGALHPPAGASEGKGASPAASSVVGSAGGSPGLGVTDYHNYGALSALGRETMQDILMLQHWLLTVKQHGNVERFHDVIAAAKRIILTPPQALSRHSSSLELRQAAAQSDAAKSLSSRVAARNGGGPGVGVDELEADDEEQERIISKAAAMEESATAETPMQPPGVEFVDGRWVSTAGDEEDVFQFSDEDEGGEEDALTADTAGGVQLPSSHADNVEGRSKRYFKGAGARREGGGDADALDGIGDLPDEAARDKQMSSSGPAGRELYEFSITDPLRTAFVAAEEAHKAAFGSNLLANPELRALISSPAPVPTPVRLRALHHQSRVLHELESHRVKQAQ